MAQPPVKLIHDKYSKAVDLKEEMINSLDDAMKSKPELKNCVNRIFDNLDPIRVLQLFEAMVEQVDFSHIFDTCSTCIAASSLTTLAYLCRIARCLI